MHESDLPGYQFSYRYHLADPVHFSKRIKVTMEHRHSNHLSDDWACTAYWYQTLPSEPLAIPAVEDRIPTRLESSLNPGNLTGSTASTAQTDDMKNALTSAAERAKKYLSERAIEAEKEIANTRQRSIGNLDQARRIRESFK